MRIVLVVLMPIVHLRRRRAATELHVFVVISTALILKQDLSWEAIGVDVRSLQPKIFHACFTFSLLSS